MAAMKAAALGSGLPSCDDISTNKGQLFTHIHQIHLSACAVC